MKVEGSKGQKQEIDWEKKREKRKRKRQSNGVMA